MKYSHLFAYLCGFLIVAALGAGLSVQHRAEEIFGPEEVRTIRTGRNLPTTVAFRQSPFLLDAVFDEGPDEVRLFRAADDPQWRLAGPADESFRFYSAQAGKLTLTFTVAAPGYSPRLVLRNEENRSVATASWSTPVPGSRVAEFVVPAPGAYRLELHYRFESFSEIALHFAGRGPRSPYRDYVLASIKEMHIQIIPGQLRRLREIMTIQEEHWKGLGGFNLATRHLPSVRESILSKVRSADGEWATAEIELAGRNAAHRTDQALPSMDVRVRAGELPYGLRRFKLYVLKSKTSGRDMVFERLLADRGLMSGRADIVRVYLNGEETGYYQLLEDQETHLFEHAQVMEGPVSGYDTDSLIANQGRSRFVPRGFHRDSTVFPYERSQDPGLISFTRQICENDLAALLSFTATYAGNHALGNDLRFHHDGQQFCKTPVVKDFNSGVGRLSPRRFDSALRQLGSFTPNWRPHAATYASYLVQADARRSRQVQFFWWLWTPATMNYFEDGENFRQFLAFLKHWEAPWNRARVQARLNNLGRAAETLNTLREEPRLKVTNALPYEIFQHVVDEGVLYSAEQLFDSVADVPDYRYLGRLLREQTVPDLRIDDYELGLLLWRNTLLDRFSDSAGQERRRGGRIVYTPKAALSGAVASFLYRDEHPGRSILVFAERAGSGDLDPDAELLLQDEHGEVRHPANVVQIGNRVYPVTFGEVMTNRIRDDERVRLWTFVVDKAEAYQHLKMLARDGVTYLGVAEMTITPNELKPISGPPLPALTTHFSRSRDRLEWAGRGDPEGAVIVPAGATWVVDRPTTIHFGPYGCLEVLGALEITSSGSLTLRGRNGGWGGAHFRGNPDLHLRRLNVEGAGHGNTLVTCNGRSYTGGLTFFDTTVTLEDFRVHGALSEDALHFFRCAVTLRNGVVSESISDGIDADFSVLHADRLRVKRSGIRSTEGGDGLDVSGSHARLVQSEFLGNEDKNLSIGENSRVTVEGGAFSAGQYGIAVKDGSHLEITGARISDNRIGLATYVKKPYFPEPTTAVGQIEMVGNDVSYGDELMETAGR